MLAMPHRLARLLWYFLVLPLLTLLTILLCATIAPARTAIPKPPTPLGSPPCVGGVSCRPLADASLMQQGKALYEAGKFSEAIAPLQQAAQHYQAQGDTLRQAIALSNLALAHQQLGQWQDANQAIQTGLSRLGSAETASQQTLPVLAQALVIQGDLQLESGQAEAAIVTWQQAESIYQRVGDASGIAQSQINQAQALRVLGYYRRALAILTDLRQNLQRQSDSALKGVELQSLGNALRLVGDLEQSRQVLQQSLDMTQRGQSAPQATPARSAILFSLGNTARAQQDTPAAIGFYQQAAELAPNLLTKVQAQINLFSLLVQTNHQPIPPPLLPAIQAQLANLPASQASIYARIHLVQVLLKPEANGKPWLSLPDMAYLLATATQQAHDLNDRRAEAYALGTLGSIYEQAKQWHHAQALTQQALSLAQAVNAPDIAYRWHWQLGRLLKQQGQIPEAIAAYDAAVNELQSLRRDLVAVNREVQFSFRESVEPIYRESVELLVQPAVDESNQASLEKALKRLEALQLAELDNFFREACLDTQTVLLDQVVDQENPTTAIIYPMILPNQLEVIVKIPQQPLHHHTIKLPKQEVERHLQQLQQGFSELDATGQIQTLSEQVYHWLIDPIAANLKQQQVNTLVFVLDGALRSIPMAGLYDGQHYLIEDYAVVLSPGLQLFPPKSLANEQLHVLAAGLIEPPLNFQQQFPPLPAIKSELDLIAQTGIAMQQLIDQAFTSQALQTKVTSVGFNIVHLATHGQFSSQAKDTFILAADGPINVTQLDSLLRSRNQSRSEAIELLVLSACQTAQGDDRATLGLAGVAVKAGARSTLASLWQIDDQSTAILIGEFYRQLATRKVTKAEALRQAQLDLLKNYPNYDRPAYWAAYVLVGSWL